MTKKSLPEIANWVQAQNFSLQLTPQRIAFLMGIVTINAHHLDGAFEEADLLKLFEVVDRAFEKRSDTIATRSNHALNELVKQRLLTRFFSGFDPIAIYRLTPLGLSIAQHYLHDQAFSPLSLSLQLEQLAWGMRTAAESAQKAQTLVQWQSQVFAPLKYLVAGIFERIDHSQRFLDVQQQQIKYDITQLIVKHWGAALSQCQVLLTSTSDVLQQLSQMLNVVGLTLQAHLVVIQERVLEQPDLGFIALLVQELQGRLDRILHWGERSIALWGKYDLEVHRFLRSAIIIDGNHRFIQDLRLSLKQFLQTPWQLLICQTQKWSEYQEQFYQMPRQTPQGRLPDNVFEVPPAPAPASSFARWIEALSAQWQQCIESDQWRTFQLSQYLRDHLPQYPPSEHKPLILISLNWLMQQGFSQAEQVGQSVPWEWLWQQKIGVNIHVIDQRFDH